MTMLQTDRRRFLTVAALGAGALVAPRAVAPGIARAATFAAVPSGPTGPLFTHAEKELAKHRAQVSHDDVVGFVRLQGGHVQATSGNLRMADHYFLGPSLVRGFAPSGIGPRDVLNDPTANALGGTTYFGGTLEVQFPIWGLPRDLGLRGAVFADAGTLFNYDGGTKTALGSCPAGSEARAFNVVTGGAQSNIACVRDKNVLRSSVGVSLLWQSPLGPIRFDYAYALSKDDGQWGNGPFGFAKYGGDRTQAFRFSGGTRF